MNEKEKTRKLKKIVLIILLNHMYKGKTLMNGNDNENDARKVHSSL